MWSCVLAAVHLCQPNFALAPGTGPQIYWRVQWCYCIHIKWMLTYDASIHAHMICLQNVIIWQYLVRHRWCSKSALMLWFKTIIHKEYANMVVPIIYIKQANVHRYTGASARKVSFVCAPYYHPLISDKCWRVSNSRVQLYSNIKLLGAVVLEYQTPGCSCTRVSNSWVQLYLSIKLLGAVVLEYQTPGCSCTHPW